MANPVTLEEIASWLDELSIDAYRCENCQALHLSHLQNLRDVYDAKLELVDDVLNFIIITEIKMSAIVPLLAELSQINANLSLVKAYLDIADDNYPKLNFSYALHGGEGILAEQFASMLAIVEDEVLQVISELNSYDLLTYRDSLSDDKTERTDHVLH